MASLASLPPTTARAKMVKGHAVYDETPSTPLAPRVIYQPNVPNGKSLFYTPLLHRHRHESVRQRFVQLDADDATQLFIKDYCSETEEEARDRKAHELKAKGYSRTDTNAMLNRGQMFVCSHAQVHRLLENSGWDQQVFSQLKAGGASMLDIGAGDGNVTTQLAQLVGGLESAQRIVTTEASGPMCKRLRERGYECYETVDIATCTELDDMRAPKAAEGASVEDGGGKFDVICLMNVLDRADRPASLLQDMKALLKPVTGRLVMAIVLPFCPFVESGSKQLRPSEQLPMDGGRCEDGAHFEWSVDAMITQVLEPAGFTVHSWSQVPYLCSGDRTTPYYILYDALFVLSTD